MKALIAMSGGVDSSMAALLTQKEGFDVTLLDVHEDGIIRPAELESAIREDIFDRDVGQIITAVSETVQHLREYIDRYDKNVTEEEINYYIKEQMKGYHAIKSRGRIPGRKK